MHSGRRFFSEVTHLRNHFFKAHLATCEIVDRPHAVRRYSIGAPLRNSTGRYLESVGNVFEPADFSIKPCIKFHGLSLA